MHRQEFLDRLRDALSGLPEDGIAERLSFYSEMIDDRVEDGLTEEEAVAEIGPIDDIVSQIVAEVPVSALVRERVRSGRRLRAWEIVLLVLGSPVWLPLLIAAAAVVFSCYSVVWAVIISLWAAWVSLIAGFLGGGAAGVLLLFKGGGPRGLALLCAGTVLAGLSILLFFGCRAATGGAVILTKKAVLGIKSLFLRKERAA